jgi:hypothetical protein
MENFKASVTAVDANILIPYGALLSALKWMAAALNTWFHGFII